MVIRLDFNNNSTEEILLQLKNKQNINWIKPYYQFLNTFYTQEKIAVQTSGTTGEKKQIYFDKNQFINSAKATNSFFNLNTNSITFCCLSGDFIAGKLMLIRALTGKYMLDLSAPTRNPSEFVKTHYNFTPLVPLQIENLVASKKINHFKTILVGGGKVGNVITDRLIEFNGEAFESFGMTETLTHFALKKIHPKKDNWFKTIGDYSVDCGPDQCLIINHPDLPNPILSNDLIVKKSPTKFKWVGRADNLINSGGIKIIPEEVEEKLAEQISIPFVIIGMPHHDYGEVVTLVAEGNRVINLQELDFTGMKFDKPKASLCLPTFPRTNSGKIKRLEIKHLLQFE